MKITVGRWRTAVAAWRRWRARAAGGVIDSSTAVIDSDLLPRLDRLTLALGRDLVAGLMGEHRATRRTAGIEFADYRPYSPGDDLRRVDWNAYARLGTLYIRQAQAEHETVLYLLVDASPSMDIGTPTKFLTARRLAAALGYIALAHLDHVALAAPGAAVVGRRQYAVGSDEEVGGTKEDVANSSPNSKFKTQNSSLSVSVRSRAETGRLFRYLQELRVGQVAAFDDVLRGWSTDPAAGRVAILISDLLLDHYRAGVRQLVGAGFGVTVLHLLSPEELVPPGAGDLELIDSETGAHLPLYYGPESAAAYAARLSGWLAECEAWCKAQGAGYCRIESTWLVERMLLETLRQQGVMV